MVRITLAASGNDSSHMFWLMAHSSSFSSIIVSFHVSLFRWVLWSAAAATFFHPICCHRLIEGSNLYSYMPPLWKGVISWNILFLLAFQVRPDWGADSTSSTDTETLQSKMLSISRRVFVIFYFVSCTYEPFVTENVAVTFPAAGLKKKMAEKQTESSISKSVFATFDVIWCILLSSFVSCWTFKV